MDINDLILSDKALKAIDEGVWVTDLDDAPGVSLLVTGLKSDDAQKAMRQKQSAMRARNKGKPLTDDQLAKATKEVLYENVLKDWKGLKQNGKELPYSLDLAKEWIMSRRGEKFTQIVLAAAQRVDEEANHLVEGVTKNS